MEQSIELISFIYHGLPAYHFGEKFVLLDLVISHDTRHWACDLIL